MPCQVLSEGELGGGCGNAADDGDFLDQIAAIKMEISLIEQEYTGLRNDICSVEEALRVERRAVDCLIGGLRQQQSYLKESQSALASLQAQHQTREEELAQELRDLEFYVRTQATVQASPLREEIKGGGLIVTESNTPAKTQGGRGRGKKPHR